MHVVTTHDRTRLASVGVVALVVSVVGRLASEWWGTTGLMVAATTAVCALAALVDARSRRIPNLLVAVAAVPIFAVVMLAAVAGSGAQALAAVALGGLAFAGPVSIVHVLTPEAMGFGDVKLAAVLGAALGLVEPRLGLLALCVASAVTAVVGVAWRRSALPFGPGLVLGATVALLIAGQLGEGALRWQ